MKQTGNEQPDLSENAELDMLVLREIEELEKVTEQKETPSSFRSEQNKGEVEAGKMAADPQEEVWEIGEYHEESPFHPRSGEDTGEEEFIAQTVRWLQNKANREIILEKIREALLQNTN